MTLPIFVHYLAVLPFVGGIIFSIKASEGFDKKGADGLRSLRDMLFAYLQFAMALGLFELK